MSEKKDALKRELRGEREKLNAVWNENKVLKEALLDERKLHQHYKLALGHIGGIITESFEIAGEPSSEL